MERAQLIDDRSRTLRSAFIANALFSGVSGTGFILGGAHLAGLIGLPGALPLQVVGTGLLPFAAFLVWLADRLELSQSQGRWISLMDAQWVVGTFVLLVGWPDSLNATGQALALGIAAVVAVFAIWQLIGARQLASRGQPAHG